MRIAESKTLLGGHRVSAVFSGFSHVTYLTYITHLTSVAALVYASFCGRVGPLGSETVSRLAYTQKSEGQHLPERPFLGS